MTNDEINNLLEEAAWAAHCAIVNRAMVFGPNSAPSEYSIAVMAAIRFLKKKVNS